jgi:predicted transcriptional regulator
MLRPSQGLLLVQNALRWSIPDTKIDKLRNRSYAGRMNLQVPPELEAKLTRLAAETGRTAAQVAIDLLVSSVDHDEWFRGEVEKGRASAREGRLLEHDDVVARMDQRYRG